MNIQDLLDAAAAFCILAESETNRDAGKLERAAQYAAIAQAHAATAQAMMLNSAIVLLNNGEHALNTYDTARPL